MSNTLSTGDASSLPLTSSVTKTAGALLRQAREAKNLRLDVLAASIKVTTAKLEALESDQFNRLPDATFTRALAQAVCRSLKIDPAPVLALMPPPNGHRLEEVAEGLKTPFNERPGRLVPGQWLKLSGATIWIAVLLVLAALVLYAMPAGWIAVPRTALGSAASAPESMAATAEPIPPGAEAPGPDSTAKAASPSGPRVTDSASVAVLTGPASPAMGASSLLAASAASGSSAGAANAGAVNASATNAGAPSATGSTATGVPLQFTTTAPSWIGVTDVGGKSLIGRLVQPGEIVDIDGALPLTLRLGHASTVQLKFRGEPLDLKKYIHDDVARLTLK